LIPSDFDAYADGSGVNDASHAERNEDRFYGGWQCGGSMTVANTHDLDPEETREWLDALSSVQGRRGNERAEFVVNAIVDAARGAGRGAGWNVIKVLWGSGWDRLLEKDKSGLLLKRMEECVDGEYQDFKSKSGAYIREQFFGTYDELKQLVADMSDDDIWKLARGGHDPEKVFAAYIAAVNPKGQPTVILPTTVKGYGMGESGEGQMIAHQAKKMTQDALRGFRDRFQVPVADDDLSKVPFIRLPEDSPEMKYFRAQRLGGSLPQRRRKSSSLQIPPL
jgi:pyruvate dehydrogenase E1 component